jgi:hypothetical protein
MASGRLASGGALLYPSNNVDKPEARPAGRDADRARPLTLGHTTVECRYTEPEKARRFGAREELVTLHTRRQLRRLRKPELEVQSASTRALW